MYLNIEFSLLQLNVSPAIRTELLFICFMQPGRNACYSKQGIAFLDPMKRMVRMLGMFDSRMYSCVREMIVTHGRVRNEDDKPHYVALR